LKDTARNGTSPLALSPAFEKRGHGWALAGVVAAGLALRVHLALSCSLWEDELYSFWFSRDTSWPRVFQSLADPFHPPLNFILVKASLALFGSSELSLRLYSLLFGCAALVAVYLLCRRMELSALPSLLIVLSLSLSRFFLRHAVQARPYGAFLVWVLLAALAAAALLERPEKTRSWALLVLSSFLACYSHYFAPGYLSIVWVVLLAGLLVRHFESRPRLRKALLHFALSGALLAATFYLAVYPGLMRMLNDPQHTDSAQEAIRPLEYFIRCLARFVWPGLPEKPAWGIAYATIAWAGIAALAIRSSRARFLAILMGAFMIGPFVAIGLFSSGHFIDPRYVFPSFISYGIGFAIPFVFLFEGALRRWSASGRSARSLFLLTFSILMLLPLGWFLSHYPGCFFWAVGQHDYAAFRDYVNASLPKDVRVAVVQDTGWKERGRQIFNEYYRIERDVRSVADYRPEEATGPFLLVEFRVTPGKEKDVDRMLWDSMGLTLEQYRAIPWLPVPSRKYQPPVQAKLIELAGAEIAIHCRNGRTSTPLDHVYFKACFGPEKVREGWDQEGTWRTRLQPGGWWIQALPRDTALAPMAAEIIMGEATQELQWTFLPFEEAQPEPGRSALRLELLDPQGEHWHGVWVTVERDDGWSYSDWSRDGFLQLWNVPPGTCRIRFTPEAGSCSPGEIEMALEADRKTVREIVLQGGLDKDSREIQ